MNVDCTEPCRGHLITAVWGVGWGVGGGGGGRNRGVMGEVGVGGVGVGRVADLVGVLTLLSYVEQC